MKRKASYLLGLVLATIAFSRSLEVSVSSNEDFIVLPGLYAHPNCPGRALARSAGRGFLNSYGQDTSGASAVEEHAENYVC